MKFTVFFLCFISTLFAQEAPRLTLLERLAQPKVSFESSYLNDANVASQEGSVRTFKNKLDINNAFAGFSFSSWNFQWDNIAELPFGNAHDAPIEKMYRLKLDLRLPYRFSDKLFMLSSISATSTFEKEMQDSYGANIFSFFSYALDDEHTFQFGAFANYHPIKTLALPIISYSYRARKTDGLQLVLGFPRAYIGYHINEKLLLNTGMIYSQAVIRLCDSSVITPKGFIESKDYLANLGLKYDLNDDFVIVSDLLFAFSREFSIYDNKGKSDATYAIDPSIGALIKLRYIF
jgi:hypothetical protein